jgi:hypothetical protein
MPFADVAGTPQDPWAGALAGLALATAIGLTAEGVRRVRARSAQEWDEPRPEAMSATSTAGCGR